MDIAEHTRKLIKAILIGLTYSFLAFYFGYIERFMPWWCEVAATLLIAAMVIMMIVNLVKLIIAVFKNRRQLNLNYFYPIVIYIAVICAPIGTWEDYLSPVKFRACYEGTQNQAYILFRNDNSF
jgi:hypothetical protein